MEDQKGGKRKVNFDPVIEPPERLLINDLEWFDNRDSHNNFTSGQNFNRINPIYQDRFDRMLHSVPIGDAIDDREGDRPEPRVGPVRRYPRDPRVRARVLVRAKGSCEFCGVLGFECEDGSRYLQSHHIIKLADDREDRMTNVIALCPNHHREAHYGVSREKLEAKMAQIVRELESGIPTPA
jgi:hypothetical protein